MAIAGDVWANIGAFVVRADPQHRRAGDAAQATCWLPHPWPQKDLFCRSGRVCPHQEGDSYWVSLLLFSSATAQAYIVEGRVPLCLKASYVATPKQSSLPSSVQRGLTWICLSLQICVCTRGVVSGAWGWSQACLPEYRPCGGDCTGVMTVTLSTDIHCHITHSLRVVLHLGQSLLGVSVLLQCLLPCQQCTLSSAIALLDVGL